MFLFSTFEVSLPNHNCLNNLDDLFELIIYLFKVKNLYIRTNQIKIIFKNSLLKIPNFFGQSNF